MDFVDVLEMARTQGASDVLAQVGAYLTLRIDGELVRKGSAPLTSEETAHYAQEILSLERLEELTQRGEVDASCVLPKGSSCRINAFRQQGSIALSCRLLPVKIPTMEELGMPAASRRFVTCTSGLVLVTGPTGSGKSTTLAAMVQEINLTYAKHIITLEDPIEYRYGQLKSVVTQREISVDTQDFATGLRAALREDPDVIMVGEMRDATTMAIALMAAETGHLVLATLHTADTAQAVERIIDAFPIGAQTQVRSQLALVLQGALAQKLLPKAKGKGRIAAYEVLVVTPALRNLIREGKTHQIPSYIATGTQYGMVTMEKAVHKLRVEGKARVEG